MGQGRIQGEIVPPKTCESNFIHHNVLQSGKQHSRYKAKLSSIVLSQQCCEVYSISLTVAKPLWDLTTKYYWNLPHNLAGWILPGHRSTTYVSRAVGFLIGKVNWRRVLDWHWTIKCTTMFVRLMGNLCCDVLLGHECQQQHRRVVFKYGGSMPEFIIIHSASKQACAVAAANTQCQSIFGNLTADCRPIAVQTRRCIPHDAEIIQPGRSEMTVRSRNN